MELTTARYQQESVSCNLFTGIQDDLFRRRCFDRREFSQRHHSDDAHVTVYNGQILKVMLAHDFPRLVHRLMFGAVIRLFYHDSANKRRLGIVAKAARVPFRVIALHGPNQTMIRFNGQSIGLKRSHPFTGFLDGTSCLQRFRLITSHFFDEFGSLFGRF